MQALFSGLTSGLGLQPCRPLASFVEPSKNGIVGSRLAGDELMHLTLKLSHLVHLVLHGRV